MMENILAELSKVPIIVWVIMGFQVLAPLGLWIYFKRELIRKKWYEIWNKEKLIKIVIHYPTGYFSEYWRLIPPKENYKVADGIYFYNKDKLISPKEIFGIEGKDKKIYAEIEGKKYALDDKEIRKKRFSIYPEIHYFYGNPRPLSFKTKEKSGELSASELSDFQENDLFQKMLSLEDEKRMLMLIFLIVIINLLATIFIILHMMEVI